MNRTSSSQKLAWYSLSCAAFLAAARRVVAFRVNRRALLSRAIFPVLASAAVLVITSGPSHAINWPTTWQGVGACGEGEVAGDSSPKSTDLVGASGFTAASFQMDDDYLYFRERVAGTPSGPGGFDQFSWVALIQTFDGNPFKYQWLVSLDGGVEEVKLWQNDQTTAANISFSPIFNDPAETQVFSDTTANLARFVVADTSIGGQQNYFVDFAVARSVLSANGIDPTTALFWLASSANANNFNKDTTPCPFVPLTSLSLTKVVNPGTVSTGATTPVTYTITLTNDGGFLARGVVVTDSAFPSWLTITNVTTSAGTVTSSTASTFEVRIANLADGDSATITVSADAAPSSATSFTNTVSAFATNASTATANATLTAQPPTPTPNTSTPTRTSTPTSTPTKTPTPTNTSTPIPTSTSTPIPTSTSTPIPTNTPTSTPTNTPTPTRTNTPSPTPTSTSVCPALNCNDGNACTNDSCDPALGCQHTNQPNGTPCNDSDACTTADACSAGACVGGAAPSCDDGNDCTDDSCNSPTGCAHVNNTSPCEDGSACTTGDMCAGGTCFGGAAPNCDDNNECTDDSCIPASGCANDNNSGPCSDGSACTTNDTCSGGTCTGGAAPDCNDGNVCTTDSCAPGTGCTYTNNSNPCTDNNTCTTTDTCSGGLCGPGPALDCSDGNGCTDDSCNPMSGCAHANNSNSCNDGSACTTGDFCSGGACTGGPPPDCNDHNVCTNDGCSPGSGCTHANNTSPCSDNNACTGGDTCGGGSCVSGPPLNCNDSNACTTDSCNPALGCENPPQPNCQPCSTSADCDNQNACDGNESCVSGRCQAGTPPNCNDGNVCTDDGCNAGSGCTHLNNNNPCNDNNACTTADACSGAVCTGGPPLNCNDGNTCTTDSCNPGSGCTHPGNTNPCDDNNACTTNDTCGGSTCNGGPAAICNDGNICTTDSCVPASGCQAPAVANGTSCADGLACNGAETCQAGVCTTATPIDCSGSADMCNYAACTEPSGSCVVTPKVDGFGCNDLNPCTASDRCQVGACVGENGADTDGDGYCDSWEVVAGCSPAEFLEIPPQPNMFTGGGSFRLGEILVAFNAPGQRWIYPAVDPSCSTAGVCDTQTRFCLSGRVGDPCGSDADCDQLANQCRVLINYGDNANLTLLLATYKQRGSRPVDISSSFSPVTPGCSRKVDLSLPSGFWRARVLLKVSGMSDGRVRRERDRLIFRE